MTAAPTKDSPLPATTAENAYPSWEPKSLGLASAYGLALLLVGSIILLCLFLTDALGPKPVPQAIQVTEATLTQLPKPTPPPPPKVVPPPKPLPAVIPKPPPVASKIAVATKPPPPIVHRVFIPHPVVNHTPPPPSPAPVSQAPQPPAPPTSGIPIYGQQMYQIIQANQNVPPALAASGVSGTAYIRITIAADGHVVSASVVKSSGVPLIDATALDHAEHASYPPFNNEMPDTVQAFTIPVEISPDPNQ